MPVIRVDFDKKKVKTKDILALSKAVQRIVSEVTHIEDVSVYANSPQIMVNAAPVEAFVQMSENKINDLDKLMGKITFGLSEWKKESKFPHKINLTFIPMKWKVEIGI